MKRLTAVLILCASLLLTACTAAQETTETRAETDMALTSAAETGKETETETDAAETKGVTETEQTPDTDTDVTTQTDTVTDTGPETSDIPADTVTETVIDTQTAPPDTTKAPDTTNTQTTEPETSAAPETTTEKAPEPVKTGTPTVKGWILTEPGMAMIYGECEVDSELTVKTEFEEYKANSDGKYFAVYASLNGGSTALVKITACADGKKYSDAASVTVKNNDGADNTGVAVTLGSRVVQKSVLPDQYGTNKFTNSEINSITETAKYRLSKAEKTAGKPVQLVYVIVPDPLTVYPEELTAQMKERVYSPNLRMKQAIGALSGIDGVTVIDLTDTMKKNKDNGKLYYKLDSHWTELGAFYAYKEVTARLGIKSYSLSDYRVDYIDIDDTDMNVYSGVGTGKMYESAPFLTALFEEQTPYGKNKDESARIWNFGNKYFINKTSKTETDANDKTALFLFDSYGFNIIPYLAESFGTFMTQPTWKYNVDYSLVSDIKPDYIIELIAERDADELLYAT